MPNHTPSDIEVMLHFHTSSLPHPYDSAPAVQDAIIFFVDNGMLEQFLPHEARLFDTTPKGKAWVKMICSTPYPTCAWVDEFDKIILHEGRHL